MKKKIGIIGCGNMGQAIAERIKRKYQVWVFDKDAKKIKDLHGIKVAADLIELINSSDALILAVKPQDFDEALKELKNYTKDKLIVSIAAGISTNYIEKHLDNVSVIRVMPNMPAMVGMGMSCLCEGKFASKEDLKFSKKLFDNLGKTLVLSEDMMDAATAISGSGPGFWCDFIEDKPKNEWESYSQNKLVSLFASAAESVGFSKKEAGLLSKTIVLGSLVTLQSSGEEPAKFKRRIASQGGTTEAGLKVLDKGGSLEDAVKVALKRAKELSYGG